MPNVVGNEKEEALSKQAKDKDTKVEDEKIDGVRNGKI